jgi:hypothetical protein
MPRYKIIVSHRDLHFIETTYEFMAADDDVACRQALNYTSPTSYVVVERITTLTTIGALPTNQEMHVEAPASPTSAQNQH